MLTRIILALIVMLSFSGCDNPFSSIDEQKIDLSSLTTPCQECPEIPAPEECPSKEIYGHIMDITTDIDTASVKMNHYVDDALIYENFADVVDINGQLATTNVITLPTYSGVPIKHILIVEFTQIK